MEKALTSFFSSPLLPPEFLRSWGERAGLASLQSWSISLSSDFKLERKMSTKVNLRLHLSSGLSCTGMDWSIHARNDLIGMEPAGVAQ